MRLVNIVAAVCILSSLSAQDLKKLQPQGYVNDFANVLDAQTRARIADYCGSVERATGAQMALVTIDTLNGDAVEDVAADLFHRWGIGKKGQDEGIMLLLAVKDHKDRIEVGYGLESTLPDGFVGQTLRQIQPQLRQSDYGGAMLTAAEVMGSAIAKAKGVNLDTHLVEHPRPAPPEHENGIPWPLIVIGIFILFSILSRIGRGGGGPYYGGYGGGGGGGLLTGMILGNILSGAGRRGSWGGGGFGGYDSGGGGGGGGFGGFGGGDSGGGGASGSW